MKFAYTQLSLLALSILFTTLAPNEAYAWFGRERSNMLKAADEAYEQAQIAGAEGRILDEMSILTESRTAYTQLHEAYPDYKTEHVGDRMKRCSAHLRIIAARIKTGEIAVPSPDDIMSGKGSGYVDPKAAQPSPSQPKASNTMPLLVETDSIDGQLAALQDEIHALPAPAAPSGKFTERMINPTAKASKADAPKAPVAEVPETASAMLNANDQLRVLLTNELFSHRNAAEAVILLEDVITHEGDSTSETTRLLLVRALIECRNYTRADAELESLLEAPNPSPIARTLASALAFQRGELAEAMYQQDRLIQEHPTYSDAYINMAFLYYTMDPQKNHDVAIVCYRSGIAYGAKRDPTFEDALRIVITQ